METVDTFWQTLVRVFEVTDLIDIGLSAAFLYVFIVAFRQSTPRGAARRVLVTFLLFSLVYFAARSLELFLVRRIVELVLVVALVSAVVVFQTDIRRLVDRIGGVSLPWHSTSRSIPKNTIDIISEAAARFAETKTGALIAIRGADRWEQQVEGGIKLDGFISLPLMYSIFDESSPGHDGALLIEGERATCFGAHLPLSSQLHRSGQGGTRHAAALGLAEASDAFVIVVSEERGTISVAERGQLMEMSSASELKERMAAFWERYYRQDGAAPSWWRRQGLQSAGLALTLATALWFLFAYYPNTVFRTYLVPIEFRNLPAQWELEEPIPVNAQVTLSGPEQTFRQVEPGQLTISFNLGRVTNDSLSLPITEQTMNLPSGLHLYRVDPRMIPVVLRHQQAVHVPVQIRARRDLPPGYDVRVQPDSVGIVTNAGVPVPTSIPTRPIDLERAAEAESVMVLLDPPEGVQVVPERRRLVRVTTVPESDP